MNSMPLRITGRYLGRLGAIVFFVVLLTVIFSFLGTIICAVLAGMMVGSMKHERWQAIPIAVVFPAVIFTLLQGSKGELVQRQIVLLALLCFGAFWVTYLVTSGIIWLERRQPTPVTVGASGPPALVVESEPGKSGEEPPRAEALGTLSIDSLQGQWVRETAALDDQAQKKRIVIRDNQITLSVVDPGGQARTVARGELKLGS
jgi:hypothetical protein